jgi:hypothetical protein
MKIGNANAKVAYANFVSLRNFLAVVYFMILFRMLRRMFLSKREG